MYTRVTLMHLGAFDTQLRMDASSTLNKGRWGWWVVGEVTLGSHVNWWKPRKWIAFADGWLPVWCASLVVRSPDMNYRCLTPPPPQTGKFLLQRTQRLYWYIRLSGCCRACWDNVVLINAHQILLPKSNLRVLNWSPNIDFIVVLD